MKTFGGVMCALALLWLVLAALGVDAAPLAWSAGWPVADKMAIGVVLVALGLTLWLVGLRHGRRSRHDAHGEGARPQASTASRLPPSAAPATAVAERDIDIVERGRK